MIIRENISFKRGQNIKKSLDVGLKRKDNLKKFIEKGLEKHMIVNTPRHSGIYNDGSGKHWIFYYDNTTDGYIFDSNESSVYIYVDFYGWDKNYSKHFKNRIKKWFDDNTDFKIKRLFKSRRYGRYEVHLRNDS